MSDEEKTSPKDYIHIHSRVYMYFICLYFLNYWIYIFVLKMDRQTCMTPALYTHYNFLSEVSHTIKIQNFDHQNWSEFFV